MLHYRLDTYHGPVVLIQRAGEWEIRSPGLRPEVYAGTIPLWCRARAREITADEVSRLLLGPVPHGEGWARHGLERAS